MNNRQKGQTMVEFIVVIVFVISFSLLTLQTVFVLGSKMYMNHCLYQSLFCLAQGYPEVKCKKQLTSNIERFVVFGKKVLVQFKNRRNAWEGLLVWKLHPWRVQLKRTLRVPEDLL